MGKHAAAEYVFVLFVLTCACTLSQYVLLISLSEIYDWYGFKLASDCPGSCAGLSAVSQYINKGGVRAGGTFQVNIIIGRSWLAVCQVQVNIYWTSAPMQAPTRLSIY